MVQISYRSKNIMLKCFLTAKHHVVLLFSLFLKFSQILHTLVSFECLMDFLYLQNQCTAIFKSTVFNLQVAKGVNCNSFRKGKKLGHVNNTEKSSRECGWSGERVEVSIPVIKIGGGVPLFLLEKAMGPCKRVCPLAGGETL
ncbi:hypothetical protein E1301_Tti006508 [Triplophysa tibetana]|uniref:Uncharacterized protein n=1 Tax=Triplophysa tibetana TaxID=1572043 RepID=A0A5A9NXZ0_9TELE|nr:hypothetical protein E1301_Tti006508 [Triplophysa tibetana]